MKDYHIKDYRTDRWNGFKQYYVYEMLSWDQSPAFPTLATYAKENKLQDFDRYWLSFLYGCTYCVPTAIHIFETLNPESVEDYWSKNKPHLLFQSDRTKVKYTNQFPKMVRSYIELIQQDPFNELLKIQDKRQRYDKAYELFDNLYYFSRFSLFNFLEVIDGITSVKFNPTWFDLKLAESARNGLCYAIGRDDMVTLHHHPSKLSINYKLLDDKLNQLKNELTTENPSLPVSIFNIETVLCAYKKLFWETRYLGYYIDRYQTEITTMKKLNPTFDASFHYTTRSKFIPHLFLGEKSGWNGVRPIRSSLLLRYGKVLYDSETFPKIKEFKSI
jgi:hypothetical protein